MRQVIHKLFLGWNYEKEEAWLNEMSAKGQQLVGVGLCRYEFEEGEPNEYTYRYELLQNPPPHPDGVEYIQFVEDTGAEHIGTMEGWAYFRKKTSEGEFSLFSDNASLAAYNLRMQRLVFGIGMFQLLMAFAIPAFLTWITGGWHFIYSFLFAILFGFAVLCAHGVFRIRKKLKQLKTDPAVQVGMADFYGKSSIFLFDTNARKTVASIIGIVVWFYLYIFLHEAGHALVGLMYGNTIASFVVFGPWPHVSLAYPYHLTDFGFGLFFAAGALLPMIVGAVAICFYKPDAKFYSYHEFFHRTADILPFITLVVWAGFPILSLFATPPPWEDVTQFMRITGIHPLLVSAGTAVIVGAFWLLVRKKGIFTRWLELHGKQKESRAANAIGSFVTALFIVIFGFVFAPDPPMFGEASVLHMNATWSDIRHQERNIMNYPLDVENAGMHSVELRAGGQGFLTAIWFEDENGEVLFWQVNETIYHSFGLGLNEGVNTMSVAILMDNDDIEDYLLTIGRGDMISEVIEYAREVFGYISDDYTFTLFVRIR